MVRLLLLNVALVDTKWLFKKLLEIFIRITTFL